jgi:hypothetical protein
MTTQKLDPEFKAKWTAALRSGEYKQGKGVLNSKADNSFCCLGVACHLALGAVPVGYFFIPKDDPTFSTATVPEVLRGADGVAGKLATMNDGAGEFACDQKSFLEIADWIDANL